MNYSFVVHVGHVKKAATADRLINTMVKQARISTRLRRDRWEMRAGCGSIKIDFKYKADLEDFADALGFKSENFEGRYCFVRDPKQK